MKAENFGPNLKSILDYLGMSQSELAERANLTQAAISQFINNERQPNLESVCRILQAIPVKLEKLVT